MSGAPRRFTAGRVARPHGLDGSFYVDSPAHPLAKGTDVFVKGSARRIQRRAGTDERPLLRLSGIESPEAAGELRGELIFVEEQLESDEWLVDDLVGCRVEGLGKVTRVVPGASCEVLELDDGNLVPLVSDAIREVRVEDGVIVADLAFLGVEGGER